MRLAWILLILTLSSCALVDGKRSDSMAQGEAIDIQLSHVMVCQYQHSQLRFRFESEKLRLDQQEQTLQAAGNVKAQLLPLLWRHGVR